MCQSSPLYTLLNHVVFVVQVRAMLLDCITGFFRRKIVLTVIFTLSLTYCILSFLSQDKPYQYAIIKSNDRLIRRRLESIQPILWSKDDTVTVIDENTNSTEGMVCRNTVQGKYFVCDSRGFVCKRLDIRKNGCCNSQTSFTKRYYCDECSDDGGCCSVYEYCVSCCLNPNKVSLLKDMLKNAGYNLRFLLSEVSDQFGLCLVKCRTSSASVYRENSYRNTSYKYCYGKTDESNLFMSDKNKDHSGNPTML